jgi:hypothetical protein
MREYAKLVRFSRRSTGQKSAFPSPSRTFGAKLQSTLRKSGLDKGPNDRA